MNEIKTAIKNQTMPAVDRLGVQNDLFALVSKNCVQKIYINFNLPYLETVARVFYPLEWLW